MNWVYVTTVLCTYVHAWIAEYAWWSGEGLLHEEECYERAKIVKCCVNVTPQTRR
jgi:hypothetical protein